MADAGRARRARREVHQRVTHPYVLRGRLYCGYCGRRMQGQYSNRAPYYRCRYPREYALASHVSHPGNVYLREADVLPAIDRWLLAIFAPRRLEQTIRQMQAAQDPSPAVLPLPGQDTDALIAGFDTRLARYQAALDAGADPEAVAEWTRQVQAERAAVLARAASRDHHKPARRLTEDDIRTLITGLARRPARRRPRRRASGEGSRLRTAWAQGHLPARTRQTPGRRHDQPGDIRPEKRKIWGNGSSWANDRTR